MRVQQLDPVILATVDGQTVRATPSPDHDWVARQCDHPRWEPLGVKRFKVDPLVCEYVTKSRKQVMSRQGRDLLKI